MVPTKLARLMVVIGGVLKRKAGVAPSTPLLVFDQYI